MPVKCTVKRTFEGGVCTARALHCVWGLKAFNVLAALATGGLGVSGLEPACGLPCGGCMSDKLPVQNCVHERVLPHFVGFPPGAWWAVCFPVASCGNDARVAWRDSWHITGHVRGGLPEGSGRRAWWVRTGVAGAMGRRRHM